MPDVIVTVTLDESQWDSFTSWDDEPRCTKPRFTRIDEKRDGYRVLIGYAGSTAWSWNTKEREITDPIELLATVTYIEEVLVPVVWSPGHMGTNLIRLLNQSARRGDWVRQPEKDLFQIPGLSAADTIRKPAGLDLVWKRNLDFSMIREGQWLHQFDKRSAYLAVMSGLKLGVGEPVHRYEPQDIARPGVYRVQVFGTALPFCGELLPRIIEDGQDWVTSDILQYALQAGYRVRVYEAWQWDESHRVLESYAARLWEARQALRDTGRFPHAAARRNAEMIVKEIAVVSSGRLGSKRVERFLRPDWWYSIVGKARVNMLRNLYGFYRAAPATVPVLVMTDSIYFVSEQAVPEQVVPGILDRQDQLGGYRHVASWRVTPEMYQVFAIGTPAKIQAWLKGQTKEQVGNG